MHKIWYLIAPPAALQALDPLIKAHADKRPVRIISSLDDWPKKIDNAKGVLVVGNRRHTPRTALSGPFITGDDGRRIPVGWLPFTNNKDLHVFASAAAEVQNRENKGGSLAFLGQWDTRVDRMVQRSLKILSAQTGKPQVPVFCWTADRIIRRDLLTALQIGLGVLIYCGHGRPYGWTGYHGLHSRHLQYAKGRPSGAILSLTCHTANRYKVGLSFAETIPLLGIAAATFGAVRPTRTVDNWYWGVSICEVLAKSPSCTLGELITAASPPDQERWGHYRILGDPLAPLLGSPDAAESCKNVWAPAPDESPIPPGYLIELSNSVSAKNG